MFSRQKEMQQLGGGVGFGSDRGKSLKGLSHEREEGINHKVSLNPINDNLLTKY